MNIFVALTTCGPRSRINGVSELSAMKAFLLLSVAAAEFARRLQSPASLGDGFARLSLAPQTLPPLPDACATSCPAAQFLWTEVPALLGEIASSPVGPLSSVTLQLDLFCKHQLAMECMIQDVLDINGNACSPVMLLIAPDIEAQDTAQSLNSQMACGCTRCPSFTMMVQAFLEHSMSNAGKELPEYEYDYEKMCPTMDTFECAQVDGFCKQGFRELVLQYVDLLDPNLKNVCSEKGIPTAFPVFSGAGAFSINMPVMFMFASAMVLFWVASPHTLTRLIARSVPSSW